MKTCAHCKARYYPRDTAKPFEKWCSIDCGVALSRAAIERQRKRRKQKELQALRERKVSVKPRTKWLQEAQGAFNAYIRERDNHPSLPYPCPSCGATNPVQWHAGHYRSIGAMPSLRFNTFNVHRQCSQCNGHGSGRIVEYRIGLEKKIGAERLEFLEGPHEPKTFDINYLRRVKSVFTKRARHIRRLRGD